MLNLMLFKHLLAFNLQIRQFRLWLCPVCSVLACLWVAYERLVAPELPVQAGLLVCFGFAAIALPYFEADMSKIRKGGWLWWAPVSMRATMCGSTLNPMQFDWQVSSHLADVPDIFFALLETVAAVRNQTAQPGEKLTALEIQQWHWNFKAEPSHPSYGDLVNRHVHQVSS